VRLSERLGSLWGWDHRPVQEATVTVVPEQQRPNSTQQIRAALDRVFHEGRQPEPEVVEGEIISEPAS
jgi:hypothetical protein